MAEEKKSITLLEYIREKEHLVDSVKEDTKVLCKKCRTDFRSIRRWEIDGKIVLRQISVFGSILNKTHPESAVERMKHNTAFEPKLAGLIDSYTGTYTYFCRGSSSVSFNISGRKFFLKTHEEIRRIFVDPIDKRTYAMSDNFLFDLFTISDSIFVCPLSTSIPRNRPNIRIANFYMKNYTSNSDIEIPINPL